MALNNGYGWLIPIGADGTDVGAFQLKRQLYVIGSADGVNIRIPYKGIHPWHCAVIIDSSHSVHVRNLHQSRNFTVNGLYIPSMAKLNHLDIIQFGKHSLRYEEPTSTPPQASHLASPAVKRPSDRQTKRSAAKKPPSSKAAQSKKAKSPILTPVPPSLPPLESNTSNVSATSMDVDSEEYQKRDQEARDYITALSTLISPVDPPSSTLSLEVAATELLVEVKSGSPTEEIVKVGVTEDGDDEELFFSQEPVQPSQSRKLQASNRVMHKMDLEEELIAEDEASPLSSSLSSSTDIHCDLPLPSSSPYPPILHPTDIEPPEELEAQSDAKPAPSRRKRASPLPTARSLRSASKSLKNHNQQIPRGILDEEEAASAKPSSSRRSSAEELDYTDDLDNSVMLDDEGRDPPKLRQKAEPKTNIVPKRTPKAQKKRRSSTTSTSDTDLQPPAKKPKRVAATASTPSFSDFFAPTIPHIIVPHDTLQPPLAEATQEDQTRHIVRSILRAYGALSHRDIMSIARSHEPYANVLRNGTKRNWKMELTARVGDPSFMPELIRQKDLVKLPHQ